jgi:hypothetical protein
MGGARRKSGARVLEGDVDGMRLRPLYPLLLDICWFG